MSCLSRCVSCVSCRSCCCRRTWCIPAEQIMEIAVFSRSSSPGRHLACRSEGTHSVELSKGVHHSVAHNCPQHSLGDPRSANASCYDRHTGCHTRTRPLRTQPPPQWAAARLVGRTRGRRLQPAPWQPPLASRGRHHSDTSCRRFSRTQCSGLRYKGETKVVCGGRGAGMGGCTGGPVAGLGTSTHSRVHSNRLVKRRMTVGGCEKSRGTGQKTCRLEQLRQQQHSPPESVLRLWSMCTTTAYRLYCTGRLSRQPSAMYGARSSCSGKLRRLVILLNRPTCTQRQRQRHKVKRTGRKVRHHLFHLSPEQTHDLM